MSAIHGTLHIICDSIGTGASPPGAQGVLPRELPIILEGGIPPQNRDESAMCDTIRWQLVDFGLGLCCAGTDVCLGVKVVLCCQHIVIANCCRNNTQRGTSEEG